MKPPIIVNAKAESFDVYIGRPSKWGNPFHISRDGDRATVIAKFKAYLLSQPALLEQLASLDGKRLGCFCYPNSCHGDAIVEVFREKFLTGDGEAVGSGHENLP